MKGSLPIHKYIHDVYKYLSHNTQYTQHTQSICVWYRRIKAPPNFGGAFAFEADMWNTQGHPVYFKYIVVVLDQKSHRRFHKEWWRQGLQFQEPRCFHDLETPIVLPCRLV